MTASIANTPSQSALGSEATTHGVFVGVEPFFLAEHSRPEANQFVFAYRIRIRNASDQPVRLLERRWTIVDSEGVQRLVRGEGVIGKKPSLAPDEEFVYASYCPLHTRWGTMEGEFLMQRDDGDVIRVRVARFFLVASDEHRPPREKQAEQRSNHGFHN